SYFCAGGRCVERDGAVFLSPSRAGAPGSTPCCSCKRTSPPRTRRIARCSSASRSSARRASSSSTRRAARSPGCAWSATSRPSASSRPLPPPQAIDHVVIAVRDLDRAAADFARLGSTLTPRGFNSIGSQTHCIMLSSTSLELLAAPVAHPWLDYYRAFL